MNIKSYLPNFSVNRSDFLSNIYQGKLEGKKDSVEDTYIETPEFFQALHFGLLEKKTDFLNNLFNIKETDTLKEALNKNYFSTQAGFTKIRSNQSKINRLYWLRNNNTLQSKILYKKNEEVKALLQDPSLDASILDKHGNTLLHYAALNPNQEIFNLILQKIPQSVNVANDEGFTPLHFAAEKNHKDQVRELLKNGGDILASNTGIIKDGITPLNFLAFNASKEDPLNFPLLQKVIFATCLLKFLANDRTPEINQEDRVKLNLFLDTLIFFSYSLSVLNMIKDKAKLIAGASTLKDSVTMDSVGSHILDTAMPSFKELKDTWSYIGYRNPFSITWKTSLLAFNLFHQIRSGINLLPVGLYYVLSIGEPINWRERVARRYSPIDKGKAIKDIWKRYCNHADPSNFKLTKEEGKFYRNTSIVFHPDKCTNKAFCTERIAQFNCLTKSLSESVSSDNKSFTPLTNCMTSTEKLAFSKNHINSIIGQTSLRQALCNNV